jgi:hypothetical protein
MFSYRQNPAASSRDISRCSSREGLESGRNANARLLESPSLLRRVIAGGGLTDLDTPPASPTPFSYNSRSVDGNGRKLIFFFFKFTARNTKLVHYLCNKLWNVDIIYRGNGCVLKGGSPTKKFVRSSL